MRRLPTCCNLACPLFAMLAGLLLHELSLPDGRAADPNAAAAQPKKLARKKPSADTTALRAQRAQAQRAAIAEEDLYGPGNGGYSSIGRSMNGVSSGSSAIGGSAFGGSNFGSGIGGFPGLGSSSGTGTTSTTGSTAGTATGTGTQNSTTGSGTTGTQGQTGTDSTTIPYLNQKALEFAVANLGKQVGSGVCWELGAEALAYANAEPPRGQVFGNAVPLSSMLPGDILEFDNARFAGANYWLSLGAPYHTAIVSSVQGDTIAMLNQNINNVKLVQITIIHLSDLRSGTIAVYRPAARQ